MLAGSLTYLVMGPGHLKERDQTVRKVVAFVVAVVIFNL